MEGVDVGCREGEEDGALVGLGGSHVVLEALAHELHHHIVHFCRVPHRPPRPLVPLLHDPLQRRPSHHHHSASPGVR